MKRKQFGHPSVEAEVYDMSGDRLDTAIGYFDLDYRPEETDYDMVRVLCIGEYAIVAYLTLDEGTPNPFDDMDGWGKLIIKENDHQEWRNALDFTSNDEPDYESIRDDSIELEVVHRSFNALYARHWYGEVHAIEMTSDGNGDEHSWNILVTDKSRNTEHTYRGSTFHMFDSGYRRHYVTMLGKAEEVMDDEGILIERWERARQRGDVGEKWGVLLKDQSPSSCHTYWRVFDHWSLIPLDEHYRYGGIWVPDESLVEDIEGRPEEEQIPRARELAKQACELYNNWANGYCYDVNVEIHKRISDTGNEFDTTEDEWEQIKDVSAMNAEDCAGGIYFGDEEAGEMMDEFLTQAIEIVYTLAGMSGKNEEGIIIGQQ